MQSSWIIVCRAVVMLTCLVALPLAAITGSTGVQFVVPLLEGCLHLVHEGTGELGRTPRGTRAVPGGTRRVESENMRTGNPVVAGRPGVVKQVRGGMKRDVAVGEKIQRGRSAAGTGLAEWTLPKRPTGESAAVSGVTAPHGDAVSEPPGGGRDGDTRTRSSAADQTGWLAVDERRLRALGATYYLLEKWGGQTDLYRFQCRVAITDNADLNRYFEATADAPLAAVDKVLQQIETWRSKTAARPQTVR